MINYKTLGKFVGKVAIALLIVACAYLFGRYQANNACTTKALSTEIEQSKQALNSFVEKAQAINLMAVDLVETTNKIGELTHESKAEYIKVVERVPVHSECIIDVDRLRIINDAVTNANASITGTVSNSHARSKGN